MGPDNYFLEWFFFIWLSCFAEPSDAGIIPPEYRTSFQPTNTTTTSAMTSQSVMMTSQQSTSSPPSRVPPGTAGGQQEKNPAMPVKQPHQFSSNPVEEWAKEQVHTVVPGFRVLGYRALPGFRALKAGDGAWSVNKTQFFI